MNYSIDNLVYSRSAIDIIERALRLIRVIDPDTPVEARERQNGLDALNGTIKQLQTVGFNLWRETEATLILEKAKQKYLLGDEATRAVNSDDLYIRKLAIDAPAGTRFITLDNAQGAQGATPILNIDPTQDIANFTANNADLNLNADGLNIVNNADKNGSASIALETVENTKYRLTFDYKAGTSTGLKVIISDVNGTIKAVNLLGDARYTIEFTARQKLTTFAFQNESAINSEDSTISHLNYVDVQSGDCIGLFLDDGSIFWTKIINADPLELLAETPEDISADNVVYYYCNAIPRPLDLLNVRYQSDYTSEEIPTNRWLRNEYMMQPNKTAAGVTSSYYYSPQLNSGELYVWQAPNQHKALLNFTYIRPFSMMYENPDAPDFPAEWFDLLSYATAYRLLGEYDAPEKAMIMVTQQYTQMMDDALGFDNDSAVVIQPDYER
jgi:hypothetical protein